MAGQIVDASLVPAPKQRNTKAENKAVKEGKSAQQVWPDQPNKAVQADGHQLRHVIHVSNTGSEVWADCAYASKDNARWLTEHGLANRLDKRKPKGQPKPRAMGRGNARKSSVRARVEHVFGHQKNRFGLFIRTIGLARAETKIALANSAYNFDRLIFHERRNAMG